MKLLIIFFSIIVMNNLYGRAPISGDRYEMLSGVRIQKHRTVNGVKNGSTDYYSIGSPSWFLTENYHYIPNGGKVLDINLKEGQNAIFLAKKGYRISGLETNQEFLDKANTLMKEQEVKINTFSETLSGYNSKDAPFDAVIAFYFSERSALKKILSLIKPGGVLILEGFTTLNRETKDINNLSVDTFLKPGELLNLFKDHKILKYEEPLHQKVFTSSIIVQKR